MTENEVFEQNRHKFVCILKEIVRGEINEEISGMFDETIEYIEEIRDAIQPLKTIITVQEDWLKIKQHTIEKLEDETDKLWKEMEWIKKGENRP